MKVQIETHGCKLNTADSQRLAEEFTRSGYEISETSEIPDVYILNSCTVTHVADKKARQALSRARRSFPEAVIVAAGCYAESGTAQLEEIDSTDLVIPNTRKHDIVSIVSARTGFEFQRSVSAKNQVGHLLGRTRAAVKIQEGCDQLCSYCIVPKVRGREKSVPADALVNSVNRLVEDGYMEVVLTGTQLGSYGFDLDSTSLTSMITDVLNKTSVARLRISSLQPQELSRELLELWHDIRLCPHFHIPVSYTHLTLPTNREV